MKKEKNKIQIFNILLNSMTIMLSTILLIYFIYIGKNDRIFACIAIYLVVSLPNFLNKTKYSLSPSYKLIYAIFVFLSHFLGSIVNLYNTVWWYDLFAHFMSGILTFVLAAYILEKTKESKFKSKITYFIYFMGFVALIAIGWEIIEFTVDIFFKTNLQHSIDTGALDTMEDMIIAIIGGIVSYIVWCIRRNKQK